MSLPNANFTGVTTLPAATSTSLSGTVGLQIKRVLVSNTGANPAVFGNINPATAVNGVYLAPGQTLTFSVDDWPGFVGLQLYGFSTLGTTLTVVASVITQ